MKILYAIQGTGNGHLARAIELYPIVCQYGEVDILVSGIQGDIALPFPVRYKLPGLSFIFGKHGGINKWSTFKRLNPFRLIRDIFTLPVSEYDLVINDFEPISAWAAKLQQVPIISLSHQLAVLHPSAPKPFEDDWFGKWVLKNYATQGQGFGFHFKSFGHNIFTPVIRSQVRNLPVSDEGHYTVYLPSYDDNTIVRELSVFENIKWQVFSKHCHEAFEFKSISVRPIENDAFIKSMANSTGVLCGAGFETPAEALFLGKKLLVIPMSGQYEQQCNAACLSTLNVPVIDTLHKKNRNQIAGWLDNENKVAVNYPDNAEVVIGKVMETYWASQKGHFTVPTI